jgi:hypothetical protein
MISQTGAGQPGQIISAITEAVIDVPRIVAISFPGFLMFDYANESARTLCLLALRNASGLTAPRTPIN